MKVYYSNTDTFLKNIDMESLFFFSKDENFKSEKRKLEFSLDRFLLFYIAKQIYGKTYPEVLIKHNKPYFKDLKPHFSISHSKNIVLICFDDYENGVDIEFIKDRNFTKLFEYYNITEVPANKLNFYRFWTGYEAKVKLKSEMKSSLTGLFLKSFMFSVTSNHSFDIRRKLKIYEVKSPIDIINPNELINLKEVIESKKKEKTLVIHEMKTALSEFFTPLNLNIE